MQITNIFSFLKKKNQTQFDENNQNNKLSNTSSPKLKKISIREMEEEIKSLNINEKVITKKI